MMMIIIMQAQKKNWDGPTIGVKVADENPREFSADQLAESHKIIGLQYGSNKGATQSGMTPYGATRQIRPDGKHSFQSLLQTPKSSFDPPSPPKRYNINFRFNCEPIS